MYIMIYHISYTIDPHMQLFTLPLQNIPILMKIIIINNLIKILKPQYSFILSIRHQFQILWII